MVAASIRQPTATAARLRSSRAFTTFAPLFAYAVFAVAWIGRGVVLHPATKVIGDDGADKTIERHLGSDRNEYHSTAPA